MPQMLVSLRACCAVLAVISILGCAEPPHKEMNQAQGAIDAARAAGADQYAAAELAGAIDSLARSEAAVAQNDYRLALNLAIESRERAQNAAKTAVETRAKARGDAERIVAEANSALTQVRTRVTDEALAKFPRRATTDLKNAVSAAQKRMQEARAALERDDYDRATSAAKAVATQVQAILVTLEKPAPPATSRKRR